MTSNYQLNELTVEITRKCPMRCTICSSEGGECDPNEMSLAELYKIIDDAIQIGVKIISLSGGEPLASPHALDFIRYVKKKGLQLFLYTCGNIESDNGIAPIEIEKFRLLKGLGVDKIIYSIHGPNAEIHETVTTKKGSFDNLITSIKNAQITGHAVELHFVPVLHNYQYLSDVFQLAEDLGIHQVSILRFVPQGRGAINRDELEITGDEIQKFKDVLQHAYSASSVTIRLGAPFNCFNINNQVKCTAGIDKAIIRPDGFVFPCVSMKRIIKENINDYIREAPLRNIWENSKIFNKIRLYQKSDRESHCKECQNVFSCQGSCITQKKLISQRTSVPNVDPYCSRKINNNNITTISQQDINREGGISFESVGI
jgi:radical SAM protein with 4Fe4S-binding SPASM domain